MCLTVTHWVACIWYLQASFKEFRDDTWVGSKGFFHVEASHLYLKSYYWALQTITSVGYGDFNGLASPQE